MTKHSPAQQTTPQKMTKHPLHMDPPPTKPHPKQLKINFQIIKSKQICAKIITSNQKNQPSTQW